MASRHAAAGSAYLTRVRPRCAVRARSASARRSYWQVPPVHVVPVGHLSTAFTPPLNSVDVHAVPAATDQEVARLKLASLGVEIDALTAEQRDYLHTWSP